MGENALFIKKAVFANHEVRYMQQRMSEFHHHLQNPNEMSVIRISGEMSFLYFGDTEIHEFEQDVVEQNAAQTRNQIHQAEAR